MRPGEMDEDIRERGLERVHRPHAAGADELLQMSGVARVVELQPDVCPIVEHGLHVGRAAT